METSNRPGYYGNQRREEKTGILQNIKNVVNWNKNIRDKTFDYYGGQAKDAWNSYDRLANAQTSNFEKKFGESKFSNKAQKIARAGQDVLGHGYNLGKEVLDLSGNVLANSLALGNQTKNAFQKYALGMDTDVKGMGQATKTNLQDYASGIADFLKISKFLPKGAPPTDMYKDGMFTPDKYSPLSENGKSTFNSWKNSTGFNTSANKSRIDMMTEKDMESFTPEVAFSQYKEWLTSDDFNSRSNEEKNSMLSDRQKLFEAYYNEASKGHRNYYDTKNEWKIAGKDYADWSSQQYRNEMIGKYGKYELEGFDLAPNISPYEDISTTMSLANNDYMEAYKAAGGYGEGDNQSQLSKIGAPTEFDYGMFDRSPVVDGPGITKKDLIPEYEYNTDESGIFANNPINILPEIFLGGKGFAKAGKRLNAYAQSLPHSKYAREALPGTLQWGNKDFGFEKTGDFWKDIIPQGINQFRRKGGQFGIGAYGVDQLLSDD